MGEIKQLKNEVDAQAEPADPVAEKSTKTPFQRLLRHILALPGCVFNKAVWRELWDFCLYVAHHFGHHRCFDSAAALTLASLFALVPLLAVIYSIVAMIPSLSGVGEIIHGWAFEHLVPATGAEVQAYLVDFARQAKRLTGVGVVMLFVTAISMLHRIERVFNRIWCVKSPRGGLISFLRYWAVLSLGPVLLGVGLGVTSYVTSVHFFAQTMEFFGFQHWGLALLPFITSWLSFSLLNWVVPNHKVPLRIALLGGLASALGFECAKRLFGLIFSQFHTYQLVYGAFAVFPLFIIWVYVSWVIVLMGAVLTRALTVYRSHARGHAPWILAVFHVIHLFWLARQSGMGLKSSSVVRRLGHVSVEDWERIRQRLLELNWIQVTRDEEYFFVREFDHLSVRMVLECLCHVPRWQLFDWQDVLGAAALGHQNGDLRPESWRGRLLDRFNALGQFQSEQMSVSLRALFTDPMLEVPH